MSNRCLLFALILSAGVIQVCAQAQDISTDRPDQANTPTLVPEGSLQFETGVIVERTRTGVEDYINYSYNNSLLKFGVNENFEARLALNYLGVKTLSERVPVQKGFGPMAAGVKIKLAEARGPWPEAAVITHVTLKTGSDTFKPSFTSIDATIALARTFGKFSVAINIGVKSDGDSPEAVWVYAFSGSYNVTRKFAFFLESYGFLPEAHGAYHCADWGITYKINSRFQLDASAGIGLLKTTNKFISAGFSVRLFK